MDLRMGGEIFDDFSQLPRVDIFQIIAARPCPFPETEAAAHSTRSGGQDQCPVGITVDQPGDWHLFLFGKRIET